MFEGLKKKFSEFVDSIAKKEKEKVEEEAKEERIEERKEAPAPAFGEKRHAEPELPKKEEPERRQVPEHREEKRPEREPVRAPEAHARVHEVTKQEVHVRKEEAPRHEEIRVHKEVTLPKEEPPRPMYEPVEPRRAEAKPVARERKPDVGLVTKLKGTLLGEVRISEKDVDPFLEQLRIALLQTDVNFDVAERIVARMRENMVGSKISSRSVGAGIRDELRKSILEIMSKNSGVDVIRLAEEKKARKETPFKILFVGPNGAGKTTTMAKMASMLGQRGIRCAISASDTFRAAAIEQAAIHAKKLGVDVVKGNYGADPASIAFDTIAFAKAHGIDAVLIDTAGRQETNKSLIEELKKMVRVNKPDLCIFVGEGIAGNALLDQVMQFNEAAKLDGIILTKLDCDAKGGNTLSILSDTKIPVLYFGVGEKYADLMPYDPKFVVDSIVPE
jgi:fused signal recognition particle receptor